MGTAATYVVQVTPHGSNSSTRERWALAAVLSLALGLRLWGVGFGLSHLETRPDELAIVGRAIRLLSGDLNPHFFHYPSLYFYALGGLYAVWGGVSTLLGGSWDGFLRDATVDPARFILIGRLVSAFAGAATVYVVYRIGDRVHSPRAGLLAAGFLAVAHLERDLEGVAPLLDLALLAVPHHEDLDVHATRPGHVRDLDPVVDPMRVFVELGTLRTHLRCCCVQVIDEPPDMVR